MILLSALLLYMASSVCTQVPACNNSDVRLVDGSNEYEGRVEICQGGRWGTVCDDRWDDTDAMVVCRQLGIYTSDPIATTQSSFINGIIRSTFGRGTGPIFLDEVDCRGNETALDVCPHRGIGIHNCVHSEDAGVVCSQQECTAGEGRLVDGTSEDNGRVELCYRGVWGTVCDDSWDDDDAAVVCRQLGYSAEGTTATNLPHFGPGAGFILLDDVGCTGNETNLTQCQHNGLGAHNCRPSEDAGVFCNTVTAACNDTDIRLVGGRNELEGRVEVCFQGRWGTVCDDFWNFTDAKVVCRQLGLTPDYAIAINVREDIFSSGIGPIFLDNVACTGTETNLADCPHRGVGIHSCVHSEDAGVICPQVPACNSSDVRLVNGTNEYEGRVEICQRGNWGTVCDDNWDDTDAQVVCRQLGIFTGDAIATNQTNRFGRGIGPNFGPGMGPIFFDNVVCRGDESNLEDCSHNGLGIHNCRHFEDAGVVCSQQVPVCNNSDVRLVNGSNEYEGRVEICQRGSWGTVCDDGWDDTDAMVVCRQLGIFTGDAIATKQSNRFGPGIGPNFGPGIGPIFLDDVDCRGDETSLDDCSHSGIGIHNCYHLEEAGVVCSQQECTAGEVRLVDGISDGNGRVELCYRGVWGTACDNSWDNNDAAVVCRQLGYSAEGATATNLPHFGPGSGFILLDNVGCTGNEANLTQCQHNGLGVHNCVPSQDAGVFCNTGQVERCSVDVESEHLNASQTVMGIDQFGTCEPYQQVSELCNAYFNETDYVYIRNTLRRTQSAIANILSSIEATIASGTAECQDNTLRIICHHFYVPCGRNGTLYPPTSICREECSYVRDTCRAVWSQALLGIAPQLQVVNCDTPGSSLAPLPSCCTGAGVIILPMTTSATPEATSSQKSAITIGASLGGALLLVIVLLVMVIIIAMMVVQKKKAAVKSFQLDVLSSPPSQTGITQDSTFIESGAACNTLLQKEASLKPDARETLASGPSAVLNPYSKHFPHSLLSNQSTRKPRIGSSYVRQLSGQMLISHENIKLLECVGQGEFGVVYKAQLSVNRIQPTLKTVAVKTLKGFFDQNEVNKIMEESVKMKQFNHPNVMSLIGVCTDAGPAPYIIMPFMANGSLLSYLRKERPNLLLSETADDDLVLEVKKRLTVMCSQIANGMEYLSAERFIHRDLAARNCMIDTHFVIKIADFGLSEDVYCRNYFKQGNGATVKLPVKWMAPESLQDGVFSDKTDVWSFGITCWEVFSGGKTPYPGVDPLSLIQLLESGQRLDKPANSACPDEMYSIMLKCWNSNPNERPPFSDLVSSISGFAEITAGYLDMSNYNPFANEVSSSDHVPLRTTEGEDCEVHSKGRLGSHSDVPSDDPPVINIQCPSEPGSLLQDGLFL